MKKQIFFLASLLFSISLFAQVGLGIELQIEQDYQFSPTTTDSTSTVNITVNNTVGSEQQISFTGLTEPFSVSDSVLTVQANSSATISVSFTPISSGTFSETLDFSGNIFGSGSLNISGEGVQVSIATNTDSLNMGSSAVDELISSTIIIYNTGTGTMEITDITNSNPDFSISQTSAFISEGGSLELSISFSTLVAGLSSSIISIANNDPSNPIYNVYVQASAVSELSGSLCGTLQLINSPFTLTGDIYVPDTCTLTIEPGVILNAKAYDLTVDGILDAHGTVSDSIYLKGFQNITLKNDSQSISYVSATDNYEDQVFFDDFEENNYSSYFNGSTDYLEWSSTHGYLSGGIKLYSNQNQDIEVYTDPIQVTSDICIINFDLSLSWTNSGCSPSAKIYFRINTGDWILLESINISNSNSSDWMNKNYDITEQVNIGDNIQIKFLNDVCSYYSQYTYYSIPTQYIDNLSINYLPNTKLDIQSKNNVSIESSTISNHKTSIEDYIRLIDFEDEVVLSDDFTTYESWNQVYDYANNSDGAIRLQNSSNDLQLTTVTDNYGDLTFSFDYFISYDQYTQNTFYVSYSINGAYTTFTADLANGTGSSTASTENWRTIDVVIPSSPGDVVDILFNPYRYNGSFYIYLDNLKFYYFDQRNIDISNTDVYSDILVRGNLILDNVNVNSEKYGLISSKGNLQIDNSILIGGLNSVISFNDSLLTITNTTIKNGDALGIDVNSSNASVSLYNSSVKDCGGDGIYLDEDYSAVDLKYSFVKDNNGIGISTNGISSHVNLSSSMVSGNGSYGIESSGQVNLDYSNITFNEDDGIYLTGNNFSNIKNSIIWGNDIISYNQINTSSGVTSITYSTVQGSGAYGTSGSQYYFGDGSIDDDPVFADNEQHMSSFSNCVDAGTPWEVDANMPYGLGGVRADIGVYGGPNNWFWGGNAVPDGATFITAVEDKPQDQGSNVGVVFEASVWDNSALVNNVTSYAVWRHFDPQGLAIDSVSAGNWELVEEMPAQSFNSYAISAESLGDSTITYGAFNTCFVVVAHTDDSDIYWYSNVACGYSTDDIAPLMPDGMEGRYAYDGGLSIGWNYPQESDFLKSLIYRDGEFVGTSTNNEFFDDTAVDGSVYSYTVEHLDAAGNASDLAFIEVSSLLPNWELASSEKTHHIAIPENFTISTSNDIVERGDFLGVFYMNNGALTCGGMAQWSDEDVVLTAFGTSEELQGFANNEEFVWRYWDASKNEYYIADVTYDSNLPNSANFIADGLSALQSIHIYAKQSINLPQGWSMISSYVQEDNTLLSALFAPVNEDVFIVKDENGTVYWPAYNFNDIGDLSELHGYKLLMTEENSIDFVGRKVIPNETVLNLDEGWQIMPYLREQAASAEVLFDPVVESIIIVKDDLGNVYWPEWGINTIGNLKPGKGYQVKMTNDRNYNYPANALVLPLEQRLGDFDPSYFVVQNPTASNMTLGIPLDAWDVKPNVLDEIAVCDAQDRVLGSAVFTGSDLVISIWEDDEYSANKQGFVNGESFQLKYRNQVNNATYSLKVTAWEQGSAQFETDEIAIVSWIEQGSLIDQDFHIYPVVPNPSSATAQLQFFSPEAKLVAFRMFNILGELVLEESLNVEEGMSVFEIPSHRFNNGTYTVKVETTSGVEVQSIQIIR